MENIIKFIEDTLANNEIERANIAKKKISQNNKQLFYSKLISHDLAKDLKDLVELIKSKFYLDDTKDIMKLRDEFAIAAMSSITKHFKYTSMTFKSKNYYTTQIAVIAYRIADQMLEFRTKPSELLKLGKFNIAESLPSDDKLIIEYLAIKHKLSVTVIASILDDFKESMVKDIDRLLHIQKHDK